MNAIGLRRRPHGGHGSDERSFYWMLLDSFATARSAGEVSGTAAESGPGTRLVTGAEAAESSIASGELVVPAAAAFADIVKPFGTQTLTRAPGVFLAWYTSVGGTGPSFGFSNNATPAPTTIEAGISVNAGVAVFPREQGATITNDLLRIGAGYHHFAVILRSTGAFFIAEDNNGPVLYWVGGILSNATLYPYIGQAYGTDATSNTKWMRAGKFTSGLFTTDWGLATAYSATASANAKIAHEADGQVDVVWTPGAGETLDLEFRRTDDDNCLLARCVQASNTIELFKRVAGVETSLAAAAAQTWTAGTPYKIRAWFLAQDVRCFVNFIEKKKVINVSHNATATEARTTLAGTNFASWPYRLSGSVAADLQAIQQDD